MVVLGLQLDQFADEVARPVRRLDLPVAEQVRSRQQLVGQDLQTLAVVLAPVVAVGELEQVHVPFAHREVAFDHRGRLPVGRTDPRAAGLADAVERVLVDLVGLGIVHDEPPLQPVVLTGQPGVDPERLGPHDRLLVVGHRPGHVHQIHDRRVRLRLRLRLPRPKPLVLLARDDHRFARVVLARCDLPLERLLVRPLEVPQRVRPGLADARVAVLLRVDVLLAARFDPGQPQFIAQHRSELVERDLDLADMPGRLGPRRADAGFAVVAAGHRLALFALALAGSARAPLAMLEPRDVDARHRDRDGLAAAAADHLAMVDVPLEVAADLAADDLPEPLQVSIDRLRHPSLRVGRLRISPIVAHLIVRVAGCPRGGLYARR